MDWGLFMRMRIGRVLGVFGCIAALHGVCPPCGYCLKSSMTGGIATLHGGVFDLFTLCSRVRHWDRLWYSPIKETFAKLSRTVIMCPDSQSL